LLIVNTASKCGLTPQFKGLEKLYRDHHDAGFQVLGFPCSQFANQEFAEASKIEEFCQLNYGVSFPMHQRVDVNGQNAHPLFDLLKQAAPGVLGSQAIKWNFTKFLVGRDGTIIRRYSPQTQPEAVEDDIAGLL
jgi:glutathione peroxidase